MGSVECEAVVFDADNVARSCFHFARSSRQPSTTSSYGRLIRLKPTRDPRGIEFCGARSARTTALRRRIHVACSATGWSTDRTSRRPMSPRLFICFTRTTRGRHITVLLEGGSIDKCCFPRTGQACRSQQSIRRTVTSSEQGYVLEVHLPDLSCEPGRWTIPSSSR